MSKPHRPIVILGPTAGGKSDLAAELALALHGNGKTKHGENRTDASGGIPGGISGGTSGGTSGEISGGGGVVIGADSMQVYRHLDAGTAKPPRELRERVRHELIDIVEPTERFTVHDWLKLADEKIAENQTSGGDGSGGGGNGSGGGGDGSGGGGGTSGGAGVVVVGGTNLYLKALLEGLFDGPGQDEAFRASLTEIPSEELHRRLQPIDPDAAARIAPADRQRLTRALEVHHLTGQTITELQRQWADEPPQTYRHDPLLIGLRWAVDDINPRINLRVKAMFTPDKVDPELAAAVCINGESLPDEVRRLHGMDLLGLQAREALGYKQVIAALFPDDYPGLADKQIQNLADAFERTKILTRRFAKQQRTWLKRFHGVHWIDMPHDNPVAAALDFVDQSTR